MKKFFSLFAAILFAGSMMAEPIVINASDVTTIASGATSGLDVTLQGIHIVWQGAYYNTDGSDGGSASVDFRVYASKSMTLTAESNISKVEIAGYCKAGLTVTADAGTITTGASYASETTKRTLEDPLIVVDEIGATSVTLNCTKQMRAYTIRVTLGEGGNVEPTMDYYVAGSMTNWGPMAAYKLAANPANEGEYMGEFTFAANDEFKVGYSDGTTIESTNYFPTGMDNNYVITEAGDYTVYFRPDGQGGEGWHEGYINAIKKEAPAAISCLEVYQKAKNDAVLLNPVTVTYSNGANVWVMDGSASMLIYLPSGFTNNFQAGDVLSGIAGVVDIYQNIVYEVKPDATQAAAIVATPGEAPAPSQAAVIEASDVNKYVILPGFSIEGAFTADSKTSLSAVLGENTVTIYNNFKFAYTFEAGKTYDIIGVVSAYKGNPQVYFISAEEAVAPVHTYTVAGNSDVLFGTAWDPANTANDMALVEGLYKWEKANLELAAGNVEFKVCEDHAWTVAYPAQNYVLAIEEAGIYTITITFDPANDNAVNAVATKTGSAEIDPVVSIAGSMNGWNASANVMTLAEDKATATLTLNLDANTYEFKVVLNGGEWRSNAQEFTRENALATEMTGNEDNMHLVADVAGEYVFTWTFADNSLAITYPVAPAETITIDIKSEVQYTDYVAEAGWWQFMAENDEYEISISNLSTTQAAGTYTVADLDADYTYIEIKATETKVHFVDGEFTLTEGEDGSRTIEGVMTGDDGNIYNIKLVFRIPTAETTVNVEIPEWEVYNSAELYGFASYLFAGEAADGTYVQIVIPGTNPVGQFTYDDVYAGGTGIEVGGEYKPIYSMNITINVSDAQRAIITADILCLNNTLYHVTTTIGEGINNVEDAVKAIKRIVNGQVVIEKAGKSYNMNGAVIR